MMQTTHRLSGRRSMLLRRRVTARERRENSDHLSKTIVEIGGCSIHLTISNEDGGDTGDLTVFFLVVYQSWPTDQ